MILSLLLTGVTVAFPMEAEVRGTEVSLGEIATVTGDDPELVELVRQVNLGGAPTPGYSRLFHALRVEQLAERRTGIELAFTGHRACRVRPVVRIVPAAEVELAASAELARLTRGIDATFAPGIKHDPVRIPAGVRGWTLEASLKQDSLRSGDVSVPVRVLVDGEIYRTVWTRWKVDVFETRTVLGRAVRAGEQLLPEDFRSERVRISRPGADNPLRPGPVVGAVATRDLSPSAVVSELDVRRPTAIRRGDSIHLQARKGAVVARVPAFALQNGAIGDRITVSMEGGREMTGVVLSSDLVEVVLSR